MGNTGTPEFFQGLQIFLSLILFYILHIYRKVSNSSSYSLSFINRPHQCNQHTHQEAGHALGPEKPVSCLLQVQGVSKHLLTLKNFLCGQHLEYDWIKRKEPKGCSFLHSMSIFWHLSWAGCQGKWDELIGLGSYGTEAREATVCVCVEGGEGVGREFEKEIKIQMHWPGLNRRLPIECRPWRWSHRGEERISSKGVSAGQVGSGGVGETKKEMTIGLASLWALAQSFLCPISFSFLKIFS